MFAWMPHPDSGRSEIDPEHDPGHCKTISAARQQHRKQSMRKRKTYQVSFTEVGVAESGSSRPAGALRIGNSPGLTGIALRGSSCGDSVRLDFETQDLIRITFFFR